MTIIYYFNTKDNHIEGELLGDTELEWIVKDKRINKEVKILKKDVQECVILYPKKKEGWAAMYETIENMISHGM